MVTKFVISSQDCGFDSTKRLLCCDIVQYSPGADFTKGLKSRFRLKFKTLVLNLC